MRYRRAFRQLSKPGFWIFFVVITLITAFVFTRVQTGEDLQEWSVRLDHASVAIVLIFPMLDGGEKDEV